MKNFLAVFLVIALLVTGVSISTYYLQKDQGVAYAYSTESVTPTPTPKPTEPPCEHKNTYIYEGYAPTCTESGLTDGVRCSDCDHVIRGRKYIPAYGHDIVTDEAFDPTCTKYGLKEGSHCANCDEIVVAQGVLPALGHDPVEDKGYPPTCTEPGLTDGSHCQRCGEALIKQEVIPPLGHKPVVDPAVKPECEKTGLTEGSHCSVCGATVVGQEIVPATGHAEKKLDAVKPTCTETGLTEGKYCLTCDKLIVKQEVVPATGHKTEKLDAVEPTCTKPGLTEGSQCANCGKLFVKQEAVPATGHNYVAKVTAPLCMTEGYTTYTCSACGDSYVSDYTKGLAHWYGLWTPNLDGTHSADCLRECGKTETVACELFEITDEVEGESIMLTVCPVCGEHEALVFPVIEDVEIEELEKDALPTYGELLVRGMETPFANEDVLHAFTAAYEHMGRVVNFNGRVQLKIAVSELPENFKLMHVVVVVNEETGARSEEWVNLPHSYEEGYVVFETDTYGLFLLMTE